jgi:DNA-binding protein YbaB
MFKNLTNLASAMRNMGQLGAQMKALNAKLEASRVYGSASSGGMTVNVEMSGLGIVSSVSISDALRTPESGPTLERLTQESMNQAIKSAKEMHITAFKELTGGVEFFPGLNEMLENMVK